MIPSLVAHAADPVPVHRVDEAGLQGILATLGGGAASWVEANGFKAAAGTVLMIPDSDGRIAAVLLGLGKAGDPAISPFLEGRLADLPSGIYRFAEESSRDPLGVLGFALSSYRFERYVKAKDAYPRLVVPAGVDSAALDRTARAVTLVRDLVNTPANDLGTAELAAAVLSVAEKHGAVAS